LTAFLYFKTVYKQVLELSFHLLEKQSFLVHKCWLKLQSSVGFLRHHGTQYVATLVTVIYILPLSGKHHPKYLTNAHLHAQQISLLNIQVGLQCIPGGMQGVVVW